MIEWVRDNMMKLPHSPAFQLVFVYEKARGALHLSCRGATKAKRALQEMFARVVLGQASLLPEGKDDSAYDLSPLLDASFQFVRSAESGIGDVQIKRLRLSRKSRKGEHITLEAIHVT